MASSSLRRCSLHMTVFLVTLLTLSELTQARMIKQDRMDRLVRQIMRCAKIPALGLSLVGKNTYNRAYGTADQSSRTSASTDTRFCLGGTTEAFTAVLLAKLIHEHENVTWSTPIQDMTGERVAMPDDYRADHITLMDILAQRSGMPTMDIVPVTRPYSTQRLASNLRYVKPAAEFREKYIPNQVLYSLLGVVFKNVWGDSWENLLKKHILMPLNMNSVMFVGDKDMSQTTNLAIPMVLFKGKPQPISMESLKGLELIKPAASLCLSTADMTRWLKFLRNGKDENNEQLIDMAVLEETFSGLQPRGHVGNPDVVGYRQPDVQASYAREQNALGWITGHYRGYQFVSQDGSIPGFQSLVTVLPTNDMAVFVAFSGDGGKKSLAAKVLLNIVGLDQLMQGTSVDDTQVCGLLDRMADLHQEPTPRHRDVARQNHYSGEIPLGDFTGSYRNLGYGDVKMKFNETEDPRIIMEYGQGVYKLSPTNKNNTFQLIGEGPVWYTTYADSYRYNPIIAVFGGDERDEERITKVTISGFDRNGDVEFSTNPVKPPRYEKTVIEDYKCGAPTMASAISLVSLIVFAVLGVFLR